MAANTDIRAGVARLLRELQDGAATHAELVESTGMADSTVRLWVQALRDAHVIRVSAWERYGNMGWKPAYALNTEYQPDAPRPAKLTGAQRQERLRERKRIQRLQNTVGTDGL